MSHRNLGIKGMTREVAEVQEWVSTVMETPWEGTFEEFLKDGQVCPIRCLSCLIARRPRVRTRALGGMPPLSGWGQR